MKNDIKQYGLLIHIYFMQAMDVVHSFLFGIPSVKRSQITANLYLGSQYNLIGLKKLKKMGITAIVNMRIHTVYSEAQQMGIKNLHLPTYDNTPPKLEDLMEGAQFIDNEISNGGKVYIHCRQGLGRGPSMAIAYFIRIGLSYDRAFNLIKKTRPFINPRPAQIERLIELEKFYNKPLY